MPTTRKDTFGIMAGETPQSGGLDERTAAAVEKVFGPAAGRAARYRDLLATVGTERGFIGPREVERLWERHVLNCGVLAEAVPEGATVIDVGSGAGLPGIPLALAAPSVHVVLLEPLLKRSTFLTEAKAELELDNVEVVRGRAEEKAVRRKLPKADVVTSRAVAPLERLVRWSLPLAKKGGEMIAMKGRSVGEELERDGKAVAAAGGGRARIFTVGEGVLDTPATLIGVTRLR